jgi:hypothetical protein
LKNKNKGGKLMGKDLLSIEEIMKMPRSEFADRCFIIGAPGAGSAFKARVAFLGNTGRSAKLNCKNEVAVGAAELGFLGRGEKQASTTPD